LAGKGIAESIDPTAEDQNWSENYASRPDYDPSTSYDEYRPAYRYGWESRASPTGRSAQPCPNSSATGRARGQSTLAWERAKHAARDAWDRVAHLFTPRHPGTV
jgi:hypothetical protein